MAKKSEVFEHYQAFEAWLNTQYNVRIEKLQSDQGQYLSGEFSDHLNYDPNMMWLIPEVLNQAYHTEICWEVTATHLYIQHGHGHYNGCGINRN